MPTAPHLHQKAFALYGRHAINLVLIAIAIAYCASNGKGIVASGNAVTPVAAIAILGACFLYAQKHILLKTDSSFPSVICTTVLAICALAGSSPAWHKTLEPLFSNCYAVFKTAVIFFGLFILFHLVILALWKQIDRVRGSFSRQDNSSTTIGILQTADKHPFAFAFSILILAWLPLVLALAPGIIGWDGSTQLNMYFGDKPITTHHPWLVTLFFGITSELGYNLFESGTGALAFLTGVSMFLEAVCYAFVCKTIAKWSSRTMFLVSLLFFFALPCFASYAATVIKDSLHAPLFALMLAITIDLFFTLGDSKPLALGHGRPPHSPLSSSSVW